MVFWILLNIYGYPQIFIFPELVSDFQLTIGVLIWFSLFFILLWVSNRVERHSPKFSRLEMLYYHTYSLWENLKNYEISERSERRYLTRAIHYLERIVSKLKSFKFDDIPLVRYSKVANKFSELTLLLERRAKLNIGSEGDMTLLISIFSDLVCFFYNDKKTGFLDDAKRKLEDLTEVEVDKEHKLEFRSVLMKYIESENVLISFFVIYVAIFPLMLLLSVVLFYIFSISIEFLVAIASAHFVVAATLTSVAGRKKMSNARD